MRLTAILAAAALALGLTACAPLTQLSSGLNPVAPRAQATAMDERALAGVYSTALAAERAYQIAYDAGVLRRGESTTVAVRAILDTQVSVAVRLAQTAYDAGNATTFAQAVSNLISAAGEVGRLTGREVAVSPSLRR